MSIRDTWEKYVNDYDVVVESCAARVERWIWSDGPHYEQEPLLWIRRGLRPGALIEPPEISTTGQFATGVDTTGRVHVIRQFDELGYYETLFVYSEDDCHVLRFDVIESEKRAQAGRLVSVSRHQFVEGKLTCIESVAETTTPKTERFHYESARLVCVDSSRESGQVAQERISYDELGEVERVVKVWPNGYERVQFSLPKKGRSVKALFNIVVQRLVGEAYSKLRGLDCAGPFFALCLAYAPGERGALPPLLGLGRVAELARWGQDADAFRWNPAEYALFDVEELALGAPELMAACRAFEAARAGKGFSMSRTLILEAARRLNTIDWSPHLDVTPDFRVFAVDFEGADLEKNLSALT